MRVKAGHVILIVAAIALLYLYLTPSCDGFVDVGHCGVDLRSCPEPQRCINGYCKSDNPPTLPAESDLPIRPGLIGSGQTRL
jgi:hypothetical protein